MINRSPYFVSPSVDWLLTGGLSILTFLALVIFPDQVSPLFTASLAAHLLWFGNWPHFSATLQRLYGKTGNLLLFPLTAFLSPLVMLACVTFSLTTEFAASLLVRVYFLWAPYHFSGQTVGMVALYLRRSDIRLTLWQRRFLSYAVFGAAFGMMAKVESYDWTMTFIAVPYQSLHLPWDLSTPIWILSLVSLAAFLISLQRMQSNIPKIILAPLVAHAIWFGLGARFNEFQSFVPLFHSIQYLPVIAHFYLQSQTKPSGAWTWYRKNFFGGALLFWGAPMAIKLLGFPFEKAQAVVFAAVNVHHFWIDGVIWKLRNPRVAESLCLDSETLSKGIAVRAHNRIDA